MAGNITAQRLVEYLPEANSSGVNFDDDASASYIDSKLLISARFAVAIISKDTPHARALLLFTSIPL